MIIGISKYILKSGNPIKKIVEEIRQSMLLLACTPKEKNLIPLKITISKNSSQ